ncbi:MAG: ARPP-1 family domain-containing protein [Miltoncostaeaceae bacterium]
MRIHIDQLHVGAGSQIGPVTTFPVWTAESALPSIQVPPLAPLTVAELDEPRIDALEVTVSGDQPVLLPEGTLLRGGMQSRVLTRDALLLPRQRGEVETTCIEAGRWGGEAEHSVAGRVPVRVISELRGVRRPAPAREDRHDRQSRVWQSIDRYQSHYGRRPTSSLIEVMEDPDDGRPIRRRYRELHEALDRAGQRPLPGQNGIMIGLAGQPVMLEVFTSADALAQVLPGMLRGLAMDAAMFADEPTPARRARRFAERLMATPLQARAQIPDGVIYAAAQGYLDVRALDARLDGREGSAHILAINSRHDLVLAA